MKQSQNCDHTSPNSDLDLEDSKPIFLHGTTVHDNVPPHQVRLQTIECFRRFCSDKTSTNRQNPYTAGQTDK